MKVQQPENREEIARVVAQGIYGISPDQIKHVVKTQKAYEYVYALDGKICGDEEIPDEVDLERVRINSVLVRVGFHEKSGTLFIRGVVMTKEG